MVEPEIEKLEQLEEDLGEEKATIDQGTTPLHISKPESVVAEE